jgi:gliding motility-associated-like protein
MKKLLFLLLLIPSFVFSQCVGIQSAVLNPAPVGGGYLPGTVVTMTFTMNGWNGTQFGSNWVEGFSLNLGNGWVSYSPVSEPGNCSLNGTWLWVESVTSSSTGLTEGPGYFYEGPQGPVDGNPGNDWGDFGTICDWTFSVNLVVTDQCDPLSLLIEVETFADGTMGSWGTQSCFDSPYQVFNGVVDGNNVVTPPISFSNDTLCVNTTEDYFVIPTLGSTYDWTVNGGNLSPDGQSFTEVVWGNLVGTYTLSVTETNSQGCIGEPVSVDITLVDPTIVFDSSYYLCPSESVVLNATPQGGTWNSQYVNGNVFQPVVPGIFYPTYTVSQYNCTVTDSIDVNVRGEFPPFPITYDFLSLDLCSDFGSHIYSVEDSATVTYYWTIDNILSDNNTNQISLFWPDTTTVHTIEVYGVDDHGCMSAESSIIVETKSCYRIYVPNSFTPNGDGLNDVFTFKGFNIFEPNLEIFNRWGDVVCRIQSPNQVWTGSYFNGGYYCENGVYNWRIYYRDDKGVGHIQNGYVTLIR